MDKPKINTQLVYNTVAALLPMEGRDFTIDSGVDGENKPTLLISPLTPIGRAWVPFLQQALTAPLQRDGVTVKEGGATAQETLTIRSVRQKMEAEADAALKAKLEEARKLVETRKTEAERLRKEQVEKEGDKTNPSEAVRTAYRQTNEAAMEAARLHRMSAKIAGIRQELDKAATDAANADAKQGRNWAVDLDAPLTSLFDQQDVQAKLKQREDLVTEIARQRAETDAVLLQAVQVAKQYIIQKEG